MFSEKFLDIVSARFTVRSIFAEMATGDEIEDCQIFHQLLCKIIIVAQNSGSASIIKLVVKNGPPIS